MENNSAGHPVTFRMELNWLTDQTGILSADDVGSTLHVATPVAFGGKGKEWSPEHLFLGAVSSCFMTTFLVFVKKFRFSMTGFGCSITGQIEKTDGIYSFSQVDLVPVICIDDELSRQKAQMALEKTMKYCLVSNSISCRVIYHPEIRLVHKEALSSSCA
jgi:organic hydroperoxide reductase OsmC/OhrA